MADIKLDWLSPLDVDNIEELRVFRHYNVNPAETEGNVPSATASTFAEDTSAVQVTAKQGEALLNSRAPDTYTDTVSDTGTYYYGVFSWNSAGYGPGSIVKIEV
jgi:hypothetical protein